MAVKKPVEDVQYFAISSSGIITGLWDTADEAVFALFEESSELVACVVALPTRLLELKPKYPTFKVQA